MEESWNARALPFRDTCSRPQQHLKKLLMRLAPIQDRCCLMAAPGSAAATAFQGSSALWAEPLALGGLSEAYTAVVEPLDRALQQMAKTACQPQATRRAENYSICFQSSMLRFVKIRCRVEPSATLQGSTVRTLGLLHRCCKLKCTMCVMSHQLLTIHG